jgi:hypothetical protein
LRARAIIEVLRKPSSISRKNERRSIIILEAASVVDIWLIFRKGFIFTI